MPHPGNGAPAYTGEHYAHVAESRFVATADQPLSTFAIDVDTASYANVRRFLNVGQLPPLDAVRIEELINYFDYDYGQPTAGHPIAIATELCDSPFAQGRKLLRVGLRATDPDASRNPRRNLVFLIDTSGSMQTQNKLPLLLQAFELLVNKLKATDRIAIVTYAGHSGVALRPTRGNQRERILYALRSLSASGSTNGAAGLEVAYNLAKENFQKDAINRVILATDGDFNVGLTSQGSLQRLIEERRDHGIFLTVLGFGMGNLKDSTMELLADHGNGNYAYIDTPREAKKVLVDEMSSTLRTVARDTKIQLELNPAKVSRYRLIGYENLALPARHFNYDTKDAGEMGAGHTVTALYELELVAEHGQAGSSIGALRYQRARQPSRQAASEELALVKVRYQPPLGGPSRLLTRLVQGRATAFDDASHDRRFAAAVAGFGMVLRNSPHLGEVNLARVAQIAGASLGRDRAGHRRELLSLIDRARQLRAEPAGHARKH